MAEQEHDQVEQIMRETRIAVLTHIDEQGRLVSLPMATQDFDDPSTVHFLTDAGSDKMSAIADNPQVNVTYSADSGWVSLSGTAARNDDRELLRELWSPGADAFLDGGPDNPDNTILTVTGDTASYWASPGKVTTVVQMAKGILTKDKPDMGGSGTVEL